MKLVKVTVYVIEVEYVHVLKYSSTFAKLLQVLYRQAIEDRNDALILSPRCTDLTPDPESVSRPRREECNQFVADPDLSFDETLEVTTG